MTRIHWVARGTGIPKDRDEVNRREVCECEKVIFYCESIQRELKIKPIYECPCVRLQT
jgi:hypothetical protein